MLAANARVYEPLRCQCALLSSYYKVTNRTNLREPAASNGLYTLLPPGVFGFLSFFLTICCIVSLCRAFG
jgi:hypothetical protein